MCIRDSYSPYLIFMLIGICFHNLFQSNWSTKHFLLIVVLLLGLFYGSADAINSRHWVMRLVRGYTLALTVFSLVYLNRNRLKPNAVLNFFAEISFPLYVCLLYTSPATIPTPTCSSAPAAKCG